MTAMLPQEIIRHKRDGSALSSEQIAAFVGGLAGGRVSEGQAAAFAMAVFWRGMSADETVVLTLAMRDSGAMLDWRGLSGPVLDKHSTGGVGDKTSLILAPLLAACGAFVPMISGRGLGHTGGTLDKLDSIPGYRSHPAHDEFVRAVRETGFAIVGASEKIAPADRRLYAIRDVTATVDSLPLIVASILSKKLAASADALVLDVKLGSGAFMAAEADARALATALVEVATGAGLPTVALLTDMGQVLGRTAGNALEVAEAIAVLTGGAADSRLLELTLTLAAEALVLGRLALDLPGAHALAAARLADGSAAEVFARGIAALGGPADLLERTGRHLPVAPHERSATPEREGVVVAIDTRALGLAVIGLGGGRRHADNSVDHRVGLSEVAAMGEAVGPHRPVARIHAADAASAERAAEAVRAAFTVAANARPQRGLVRGRIATPPKPPVRIG